MCCFVIKHCSNLKNEFEFKKLSKKVSKQNFKTNYLDARKNLHKNFDHSIFNDKTSIVSSFRWFLAITTNQKRQNNWKSLRNLLKHSYAMNFSYFIFKSSRNHSKIIFSIVSLLMSNKNITKYFRQKITWRFQQKHAIEKSHECEIAWI